MSRVSVWYRDVSCITHSRAETERVKSTLCNKYVINQMPRKRTDAISQLAQLFYPSLDDGFQRRNLT